MLNVLGKFITLLDGHGYLSHEFIVIEGDFGNAADDHAPLDRRTRLEAADIVKRGLQLISLGAAETAHVADLEREYQPAPQCPR